MSTLLQTSNILVIILAFSFLIFVHELGHFLAALLTGVRVEKFMLGFDVWGIGFKRKVRGIEYGIGLLPLGGYVKLAGQSDVPGEEVSTGAPDELMSKGVAARGLIFGAGVLMNLLFGFFILVAAQLIGVPYVPAVIHSVQQGSPAQKADLQNGDRVLAIDGKPVSTFTDLAQAVAYSAGDPMFFTIERTGPDGTAQRLRRRVMAERGGGRGNLHYIGAYPRLSNTVKDFLDNPAYGVPHIDRIKEHIDVGDRVVRIGDTPVDENSGSQIEWLVQDKPGARLPVTIEKPDGTRQTVTLPVLPYGRYPLGLRYRARISTVVPDTPAAGAGLQKGDFISAVDHTPLTSETPLSKLIRAAAFGEIEVTVRRGGQPHTVAITPAYMGYHPEVPEDGDTYLGVLAEPAAADGSWEITRVLNAGPAAGQLEVGDAITALGGRPVGADAPLATQVEAVASRPVVLTVHREKAELELTMRPKLRKGSTVPIIGIMYRIDSIDSVEPGSLAETLGLGPQDSLVQFALSTDLKTTTITWRREGQEALLEQTVQTPAAVREDPAAAGIVGSLGILPRPYFITDRAPGLWAACRLALPDAIHKTLTIYRFLHGLISQRLSPTSMGGPLLIFQAMMAAADVGWGKLLDMVAFISINLAVLNLLPIPVLDGGHLLFLVIEAIKGSRPSAKVQEYAQYAGFICLLGLMLMVTAFDVYYSYLASWFGGP